MYERSLIRKKEEDDVQTPTRLLNRSSWDERTGGTKEEREEEAKRMGESGEEMRQREFG